MFSTLIFCALIHTFAWEVSALPIPQQIPLLTRQEYDGSKAQYNFTQHISHLTMTDGVNISVTFAVPEPHYDGEAFPVLLDYRPYRKDDSMYTHDHEFLIYFAKRGYVVATADIRGTGSSGGRLVPKEYSDAELEDGAEIIRQLAHMSWRNGSVVSNQRVGMYGQSWGAFNALILASRQTPYLTTIYALHGSEDLFGNDMHYLDGAKHYDEYMLSVDHENALPKSPEMRIDDAYFAERFNATPWSMVYLRQQTDSTFWSENSGMYRYDQFRIPIYVVGGLLDSYRDFCLRYHEGINNAQENPPRVKCTVGPWNHNWPQDSPIGPNYDGLGEAVRWFDQWMKDVDTGILDEPDLTVFVRDSHKPDPNLRKVPGRWIGTAWPIPETEWQHLHMTADGSIAPEFDSDACSEDVSLCRKLLPYKATVGTEMGNIFGEQLGDQASLDKDSLVFDSPVLSEEVTVIGFCNVSVRVSSTAKLAHWAVRLEDVHPDGQVTHITGSLQNAAHRNGRDLPEYLTPGEDFTLSLDLHFSTWTFPKGHRIRVAVTNALFRVAWPTPYRMNSTLLVNHVDSWIKLPVVPRSASSFVPPFTSTPVPQEATEIPSDATRYAAGAFPRRYDVQREGSKSLVTWSVDYYFRIKQTLIGAMLIQRFIADDENPAKSAWLTEGRQLYVFDYPDNVTLSNVEKSGNATSFLSGDFYEGFHHKMSTKFPALYDPPSEIPSHIGLSPSDWTWIEQSPMVDISNKRWIQLDTKLAVVSDENYFYSSLTRSIYENGRLKATKSFTQKDKRQFI